jgi:hypothetical protein
MAPNLQELMTELGFEQLGKGTPAMWAFETSDVEILIGQLSDGEIHVTKTVAGEAGLPIIVRLNRYDDALGDLLRGWALVSR